MTYVAIAVSVALLVQLCLGDPKRRRVTGNIAMRRALAGAAWMPGVLLALSGDAAAFLIWFGACSVTGWLLALAVNTRQPDRARSKSRPRSDQPTKARSIT